MRNLHQLIGLIIGLILLPGEMSQAGEWPRFMGPNANGVVTEGEKVARAWPDGKPKELWKVDVGTGFGGAAIVAGKVYFLDRTSNAQDVFRVLDLKSGKTLWEHAYDAPNYRGGFPGSRGVPTVDGDLVYTVGVLGHVHCFDVKNKKVVWNKSLTQDFGARAGGWGFAQSPLIRGDHVILSAAGGPNGLVALNKKTGDTVWKTPAFGNTDTYTSPMLITLEGVEQVLMWHRGELGSFNPDDGRKLWSYRWRTNRPIPQPVDMGDGRIFLTIGYGGGSTMLRISKSGNQWKVDEEFQDGRSASKVPPALLYKGHLYINSDDNKRGLQCLDANGNVKWETLTRPDFQLGSLIIADGVIFIINGQTGDLVMAEASPDGYKELGRARMLGGRDIWAPLAISNGLLVIRDQEQMKCLEVGAELGNASARD